MAGVGGEERVRLLVSRRRHVVGKVSPGNLQPCGHLVAFTIFVTHHMVVLSNDHVVDDTPGAFVVGPERVGRHGHAVARLGRQQLQTLHGGAQLHTRNKPISSSFGVFYT